MGAQQPFDTSALRTFDFVVQTRSQSDRYRDYPPELAICPNSNRIAKILNFHYPNSPHPKAAIVRFKRNAAPLPRIGEKQHGIQTQQSSDLDGACSWIIACGFHERRKRGSGEKKSKRISYNYTYNDYVVYLPSSLCRACNILPGSRVSILPYNAAITAE
mmetsp:Transcript_5992/g.8243  ORF Transcript_5992/g.8243 Transcript_5992/m.8243 type:complete len:160 (-) Transcript_5992:40-519(-)